MKKIICAAILVLSAPNFLLVMGDSHAQPVEIPAKYDFTWNVYDQPSNNNFGQKESRDGDSTVGSYFVLLPDGRTQKVSYTVDAHGYKAEVTYEGEARPYQQQQQPKAFTPSYPVTQRTYETAESSQVETKLEFKAEEVKKDEAQPKVGEVYYKPLENAPEPKVYYKPLPEAEAQVYYKPLEPEQQS